MNEFQTAIREVIDFTKPSAVSSMSPAGMMYGHQQPPPKPMVMSEEQLRAIIRDELLRAIARGVGAEITEKPK